MDYQNIRYELLGRVARISHARPHRRNAQNVELLDELDHALQRAVADPEIRVIVIAGQGDHFSAGHDLKDAAMHRRQITRRIAITSRTNATSATACACGTPPSR
jgi:enoyl-CoA hydratase